MKIRAVLIAMLAATLAASSAHAAQKDAGAGWYSIGQKAAALEQAKKLGRPIAVLWYAKSQNAGASGQWIAARKRSGLPKQFVCIVAESTIQNNVIGGVDPLVMQLLQTTGLNLAQLPPPPYLLLGTAEGKCYSHLTVRSTPADTAKNVQIALDKHGNAAPGKAQQRAGDAAKKPDDKAKQPAGAEPVNTPPKKLKIKSWYGPSEQAMALRAARALGRPVAVLWHVGEQKGAKIGRWQRSDLPKYFVGMTIVSKMKDGAIDISDEFLVKLYSSSGLKGGLFPPYVFLATIDGHCYAVINSGASAEEVRKVMFEALKKYGKLLSKRQAFAAWQRLEAARRLWAEKKHEAAMPHFRALLALKEVNPNLPIITELNKDVEIIDRKGAEDLQAAEMLLADGKFAEAEAQVRKIYRAYQGFDTTKDAKELFKKVKTAQKSGGLADRTIKQVDDKTNGKEPPKKDDDKGKVEEKKDDKTKPDYNDDF